MIVLDRFEKWSSRLDEQARQYLSEAEYREYCSIPGPERLSQLKAILEKPIAHFSVVNELFFRARWAEVLAAVHPGKELALLEIASGDADMIPQMMAPHSPAWQPLYHRQHEPHLDRPPARRRAVYRLRCW